MMWFLSLVMLIAQVAGLQSLPPRRMQRLPLQKKENLLKTPTNYEKRVLRYDPETGEPSYYDPKPQVVLVDAKSGKYALKWIGYDGQEKTIIFQRADAIDAVVSASVSKTASGRYLYSYTIENLPSSGESLAGFAVQNLASDVKPLAIENIHIGHMTKLVKEFKAGNWIRFAPLSGFQPAAIPGQNIEFRLESSAPPGLVECRIHGGEPGMKGVGEEMPQELEHILPGYEAWPSGYTIGPVDTQNSLSPTERANYIKDLLPQFQRLGWITPDALRWYEQNLRGNSLGKVFRRAEQDLKAERITTEVRDMIQATSNSR